MSGTPVFTTQSSPDGDPFEGKVDEATDYYQKMLYGDEHYYGPAIDAVLREAIRESFVADGSVSIEKLCEQLDGPRPSDFEMTVAEGLRSLIEERVEQAYQDGSESEDGEPEP